MRSSATSPIASAVRPLARRSAASARPSASASARRSSASRVAIWRRSPASRPARSASGDSSRAAAAAATLKVSSSLSAPATSRSSRAGSARGTCAVRDGGEGVGRRAGSRRGLVGELPPRRTAGELLDLGPAARGGARRARAGRPRPSRRRTRARRAAGPSRCRRSVTAGTVEASSSSRATTGRSTSWRGSRPTSTSSEPSPAAHRLADQLERRAAGSPASTRGRTMAERRGDRALAARLDLEQLQRELLAVLGECAGRRRDAFALGERLLERDEPLARQRDARLEIFALAQRGACGGVRLVGGATELGRRRAGRDAGATRRARARSSASSRCADSWRTPSALCGAAQREQRVAAAARQHSPRSRRGVRARRRARPSAPPASRARSRRRAPSAPRPRPGAGHARRRRSARSVAASRAAASSSTDARRIVRACRLELGAERRRQRARRLAAKRDALAAAAQPVERGGRLLARTGGIGQLLLGPLALGDERGDLLVEHAALLGGRDAAPLGLRRGARRARARSSVAIAACRRAISTPSFSARSAAVACRASGRSRFLTSSSRSRARSTWMPTRASFSSARCRRRLKRPSPAASSISSRRSCGFELSTVSTRPCEMTERRPPPSPTSESSSTRSMRRTGVLLTRYWPSPPRCRRRATETSEYGSSGQAPSALSKSRSTSQRSVGWRPDRAGEEHVVGLLGAQLARAHRAGRPEDRVGDVRLAGAVRPDDDRDSRLEPDLDRVHERLEPAQLDRLQVHAGTKLSRSARTPPR